jgi:penicillin-binding protein-related factor A (putative recombinase)
MEGYIVMGDLCNLEKQEEIKSIIASICKKITPKVEFGKNIAVTFRPIIYSPYKLGFNLHELRK